MTPQELKASILQLAIQGKLVKQLPEEGTSIDLLRDLRAEKEKIVESGVLKGRKTKPLQKIIIDDFPFEIPSTWSWIRLGEVTEIFGRIGFRGYTKNDIVTKGNGAITISPSNILSNGKTSFIDCTYLSWEKYEESPEIKVFDGDILLVKTGSSYGKCGIVSNLPEKATINPQLAILKFITCDVKYLDYVLKSPMARSQFESFVIGTSIPTFSQEKLANLLVPLPPLAEQKRIVAKIEELLPLIDRYEQAWSKLEEFNKRFPIDMQKSILQMAIQGKLVPQLPEEGTGEELFQQIQEEKQRLIKAGTIKKEKPLPEITEDEIPFDIPDSWKWVRWGDLSKSIQYGYNAPAQEKGRIKMVRISDIQDGKVLWDTVPYCDIKEDEIPTYLLGANDILFARTGGTVGKSYLVKNVPEEAIYAGYLIRTQYSSLLCPEYMKYFMESQLYWDQLRNGTIATAQPNCNGKTLSKMILPLPPLAEQKRIVAKLEEILPLCERLK